MPDPAQVHPHAFNWGALLTGLSTLVGSIVAFFSLFPTRRSVDQRFKAQSEEEVTYRAGVTDAIKKLNQDVAGYAERTETGMRETREDIKVGFARVHERIDKRLGGG